MRKIIELTLQSYTTPEVVGTAHDFFPFIGNTIFNKFFFKRFILEKRTY